MLLKFSKMQGLGNDYIYINCMDTNFEKIYKIVPKLCNRNFGIGSDGVILILSSSVADFRMRMFNSDGSEGEMCGNGIRCVGKFVYDKKLTQKKLITVETLAGIKKLDLIIKNDVVYKVKVDMGKPYIEKDYMKKININDRLLSLNCISVGNPHAVIFVDDVNSIEIGKIGPVIENNKLFPNRTNVEFVQIIDKDNIKMRVWERGAGETLACGTGACASVVASVLNGYTNNKVSVHLLGGDLQVEWNGLNSPSYMTGPADFSFEGQIVI